MLKATTLLAALLLPSCSLAIPSSQSVAITTTDPRAEIYVDGNLVGKGTASINLQRNKTHAIMAKVGDRSGVATIGNQVNFTGVLDIIGGFLFIVPFIGLVSPGFWSLDETTFNIVIPPEAHG